MSSRLLQSTANKQSVYPSYITKSFITPSNFPSTCSSLLLDLRTQLFYFNFIRHRKKIVEKKENCWSSIFTAAFIHVQAHFAGKFIIYWKFFSSPELLYPLASPLSNTIRIFNTSYMVPFSQLLLISLGLQNITIQY